MKSIIGIALIGWLACSRLLAGEPASASTSLFQATRAGDHTTAGTLLQHGGDIRARDDLGNTPLMAAALNADAAMLGLLLEAGADVNATNQAGATALMRAATFEDKARMLMVRGAEVKARSQLGNTALILAARKPGNSGAVKLLLDRGAEPNATNGFGATALMAAAAAEDMETVRLLLDHGADVNARPNMDGDGFLWGGGRTPLVWAAFRGNQGLIKLLLARGARVNDFTLIGGALAQAAWAGHPGAASMLLEAGAQVDQPDLLANYTPLHWAASSEKSDDTLVNLLLARGANANAEGGQPVDGFLGVAQTPLMLARKRGETPIVQALLKSGAREVTSSAEKRAAKPARPMAGPSDDAMIADAIRLALPPLQKSALESRATYLRHASKQDCVSCHQQQLPLSAISLARTRHIAMDDSVVRKLTQEVGQFGLRMQELDLETTFHPEPAIGNGYGLFALHAEKQAPSASTDSQVHQLTVIQNLDGYWHWNLPRPPIQSSDIGATALAVQAIKSYAPPGRQREMEERIGRARVWLEKARPEFNEERVYQLLGLAWAGEGPEKLTPLAEALIREQRPDGGWGQLPKLASDAFATGQSLYALLQGGGLPVQHAAVRQGVRFLLRTQLADGTWHVRRRAFPFQPPMDSSFPHGADGWISSAATSWAVMALALVLDPVQAPATPTALAKTATSMVAAATAAGHAATPVEFARDIQPLFERSCVACHSGERAKGGFRVTDRASILQGGKRGEPAVVPGKPGASPLLRYVSDQMEDLEMPPLGRREKFPALTKDETTRLYAWIEQGARWPDGAIIHAPGK